MAGWPGSRVHHAFGSAFNSLTTFQNVVLGNCCSAPWHSCGGVPQGYVLSPVLLNIYMKLLGEIVQHHLVSEGSSSLPALNYKDCLAYLAVNVHCLKQKDKTS